MLELTSIINQIKLSDTYIPFYANTKEYIFYSIPPRTFSKIDHIPRHKASFNRCNKIEIIPFRPPWMKVAYQQQQKQKKS